MDLGRAAAIIQHRCVIVDIDGTIMDNSHRTHHLEKRPKDWKAYNAAMADDIPFPFMVTLLKILRPHFSLVLATGREEKDRETTVSSLRKHDVWFDQLYMRDTGDFRPDHVIKAEMLQQIKYAGYTPQMVIEDRASVVKMWRSQGLLCLQCAEGDF